MTPIKQETLLIDLCGRQYYNVKVQYYGNKIGTLVSLFDLTEYSNGERHPLISVYGTDGTPYKVKPESVKPYLIPLSKMSEEQKEEYYYIVNYLSEDDTENYVEGEFIYTAQLTQLLGFYHRNNIDYRGLIPMGLAIDATGLNIYD